MRFTIIALALGAGLALPGPAQLAWAQWPAPVERALSREYNDCMARGDAARGATAAMRECSGAEMERQDARLNQAYRMTMQRLPKARQAKLRTAQRAWIRQRDRTCTREALPFHGGTMAPLTHGQCALRETIARRLWLERYR